MLEKFIPHNFTQDGEALKSRIPQTRVNLGEATPQVNFSGEIQIRLPSRGKN